MDKQTIKQLVNNENPVLFEIGANNGSDTQGFLDLFEQGNFHCFEPDPRAYKKLTNNINDKRCHMYQTAISNQTGTCDFHQSDGWPADWGEGSNWDMSGSIKKPKNHIPLHPWCKFDNVIKIDTITLDNFIDDYNKYYSKFLKTNPNHKIDIIDFIWADTQGAEKELIEGGLNTLKNKVRYLYTEYSNDELYEGEIGKAEILKLLPDFIMIKDFGTDVLLKNRNL